MKIPLMLINSTILLFITKEEVVNLHILIYTHTSTFTYYLLQAQMPDPKTYKQHFENKHPKNDLPEDLKSM